jgi:hypothetical protein
MRAALAHSVSYVKQVSTKFGPKAVAEIQLQGEAKKEFWMSVKQGEKLADCFDRLQAHGGYSTKHLELHIILDQGEKGERFVWCGTHSGKRSDLPFLEEKFSLKIESPYIGRVEDGITGEALPELKDE